MLSPLRYPGGKAKLFPFFSKLIAENDLYDRIYAEPYAGGAGLALKLLAHGYVRKIELNDIDPAIAAFWHAVLNETEAFCSLVSSVELSVNEWRRQKEIYAKGISTDTLKLAFATYFLNRTSRSGIIEGSGPIGGYAQSGEWKIDARFNRTVQIAQLFEIARFKENIQVSCLDALDFTAEKLSSSAYFTYLDPPYYVKGQKLYKNFYVHDDHLEISKLLNFSKCGTWILSYDYTPEIIAMYPQFSPLVYSLQYSAGAVGKGFEVMFAGDELHIPEYEGFQLAASI